MSSASAGLGTTHAGLVQAIPATPAWVPPSRSKLSPEDIGQDFHLPIAEAASNFGVYTGVWTSVLKRICRKNNLVRWPYRKLESSEGQGHYVVMIPFISSNWILLTFDDNDDCKDDDDDEIQCSTRITNHFKRLPFQPCLESAGWKNCHCYPIYAVPKGSTSAVSGMGRLEKLCSGMLLVKDAVQITLHINFGYLNRFLGQPGAHLATLSISIALILKNNGKNNAMDRSVGLVLLEGLVRPRCKVCQYILRGCDRLYLRLQ